MTLLRVLDGLDRVQKLLEEEFPECRIGYAYRDGHVTWSAQLGPALNADSPESLRDAIKSAYAEVLEKISERERNEVPAVAGEPLALTAGEPVCEPDPGP